MLKGSAVPGQYHGAFRPCLAPFALLNNMDRKNFQRDEPCWWLWGPVTYLLTDHGLGALLVHLS